MREPVFRSQPRALWHSAMAAIQRRETAAERRRKRIEQIELLIEACARSWVIDGLALGNNTFAPAAAEAKALWEELIEPLEGTLSDAEFAKIYERVEDRQEELRHPDAFARLVAGLRG